MKCDYYGYERWTKKEIIRNAIVVSAGGRSHKQ